MPGPTRGRCARWAMPFVLPFLMIGGWGCSNNSSTTDIAASTNTAPVVTSVTASPNVVIRGGTSQITVNASDAEQDDLTYTFTPNGGSIDGSGQAATWVAPTEPGKYIITVAISDGRQTTEAWVTLTVFAPLTTLTGTLFAPGGSTDNLAGARVILRAGATDVSNDQLVRYISTTGAGPRVTFVAENVIPGTYYLEAWQDIDGDDLISNGDYYGRYGNAGAPGDNLPPLALAEGQTRFVLIQMAMIPTVGEDDTDDRDPGTDGQNIKGENDITDDWADR